MTSLANKPKLSKLISWSLLAVVCLLVLWPMFQNQYVLDDSYFIIDNPAIRSFWPPGRFFNPYGENRGPTNTVVQRPVMAISLTVDYALWKLNPFGYHLSNFLLHLLCVFGVAALTQGLSGSLIAGFLSGALFAVIPGHAEAVTAFLGRSDLLSTLFMLLGFWAFHKHSSGKGLRKGLWYAWALASFALACFSKETGLALLGLLVVYELFAPDRGYRKWKQGILRLAPFVLVALFYLTYRESVFRGKPITGQAYGVKWWGDSPYKNFLMAFEVYASYLRLLVFPHPLSPLHEMPVPKGFWEPRVLWGGLLFIVSLGGTVWALRKRFWAGLLASWFLIGLAPVANIIPIPGLQILAERWLYLPSVGFCALAGWGAWGLYRRSRGWTRWALIGFMAMVWVVFGAVSFRSISTWKTEETLGRALIAAAPQNAVGYSHLGYALCDQGKFFEAEQILHRAVRFGPEFVEGHYNLGVALYCLGKPQEAEKEFRETLRLDPYHVKAHNNLGAVLWNRGDYEGAEAEYREAIRLKPSHAAAHNNLGNALGRREAFGEAEKEYREAIRWDPGFAEAHYNLGNTLVKRGAFGEAAREYHETLRLKPAFAAAYLGLGIVLGKQGRSDEAITAYRQALALQPGLAEAYYHLACSYALRGDKEEALRSLQAALNSGYDDYPGMEQDKDLDSLRGDARFKVLSNILRQRWEGGRSRQ